MASTDHAQSITQISQLHVSQHIKSTLLQLVHKQDELTGRPRVGHHQQHLRPPELHVFFSHIQHQQILTHLFGGRDRKTAQTNCKTCWVLCVSVSEQVQVPGGK